MNLERSISKSRAEGTPGRIRPWPLPVPPPPTPNGSGARPRTELRRAPSANDRLVRDELVALMAGGVAHRFNNLLTSIQGNVLTALEDVEHPHREAAELLEAAHACREAVAFAADLLAISGHQWARPRVLDVREALTELDVGRIVAGQVTLCRNFSTTPCWALLDPEHIATVVLSLIQNAADAVGERGVIQLRVDPVASREGRWSTTGAGWVRIEVADNGPGMESETLSRAFDPFFTTRGCGVGRGLGLSIATGLARGMGGRMAIASRPGAGTQVCVWFPAVTEGAEGLEPSP